MTTDTPDKCPFCRKIRGRLMVHESAAYGKCFAVDCTSCRAVGPLKKTPKGAITSWNRAQRLPK